VEAGGAVDRAREIMVAWAGGAVDGAWEIMVAWASVQGMKHGRSCSMGWGAGDEARETVTQRFVTVLCQIKTPTGIYHLTRILEVLIRIFPTSSQHALSICSSRAP